MSKGLRAIIFDQDGTLYPVRSPLYQALRGRTKSWLSRKLEISAEDVDTLYVRLQHEYPNPLDGFRSLGASIQEYHKEVFGGIDPKLYLSSQSKLRDLLESLQPEKYIVTLAPRDYSIAVQSALGIHDLIKKTLFIADFSPVTNKNICYRSICLEIDAPAKKVCVVGDNFEVDLRPAVEAGFIAIHISDEVFPGSHMTATSLLSIGPLLASAGG